MTNKTAASIIAHLNKREAEGISIFKGLTTLLIPPDVEYYELRAELLLSQSLISVGAATVEELTAMLKFQELVPNFVEEGTWDELLSSADSYVLLTKTRDESACVVYVIQK